MTKNSLVIIVIAFLSGVALCYVFLPTKTITKEVKSKEQSELIAKLKQKLKTKNNVITTRTIYKDRIVEKIIDKSTTDIDTFKNETTDTKTDTIENTKIEINKKKLGVEVGIDVSRSYYIHGTYDITNSFFVGTHGQIGKNNTLGIGLGLRL